MRKFTLKLTLISALILGATQSSYAETNFDAVDIMLKDSGLDLSDPSVSAKLKSDRQHRSNDPRMQARVYKLDDGRKVKLFGHKFKAANQIDKIVIIYEAEDTKFKGAIQTLTDEMGAPSAKRPDILTWRVENPNVRSTQAAHIRVTASQNKNGNWKISADRRIGKRGNNNQRATTVKKRQTQSTLRSTQLRPQERD